MLHKALLILGIGLLSGAALSGANRGPAVSAEGADELKVFTCPMHPEITSDKPGHCPKCKMKLVPKATSSH
ncbi:MAG: hypothetical protein IPI67_21825 [Myxococcales bacterium]|nr:hypothetical protein [Myxococcales bacterium]